MLGCVCMRTAIIKWDRSMAARCLERCSDFYCHTAYTPLKLKSRKPAAEKALPVEAPVPEINIAVDEWDGFQRALSSVLKKKHE